MSRRVWIFFILAHPNIPGGFLSFGMLLLYRKVVAPTDQHRDQQQGQHNHEGQPYATFPEIFFEFLESDAKDHSKGI